MLKTESEIDQIIKDVLQEACPDMLFGSDAAAKSQRRNKEAAQHYCERFANAMDFGVPYQSEAEAINALAPVAVWFFGWAARRFAIYVIRLMWRRWHADPA